jgi:RecA/RadA recombinase
MELTGDAPKVPRVETGYYSLDESLRNRQGQRGYPLGTITEVYGANHTGKSTMVWSLSGLIGAKTESNIALADLEGFDPEFLTSVMSSQGFNGEVYSIQDESDEKVLETLSYKLDDKDLNFNIGILDSIGAISPIAEAEGDLGDANMGRRAFLTNQFFRKAIRTLRVNKNKLLFSINHQHPNLGTYGYNTPGGEGKKYLSSIRIQLKRLYRKNKEETYPDGSYVLIGRIVKNRWGYKDREFYLFVLGGSGIHKGLTALYDGIVLGLVDVSRTIKIGDQSFGYLKDITERAQAGDEEFFIPFYEVIENARDKDTTGIHKENNADESDDVQDSSTEED